MIGSSALAQDPLVLKGTLQGGMMGIGGEHTGFVLEGVAVEVDLGGIEDAGDLAGQAVRLQGYFDVKDYIERGAVPLFHVTAAKLASDLGDFPSSRPSAGSDEGIRTRAQLRAEALRMLEHDEEFRAEVRRLLQDGDKPVPR